MRIGPGRRKTSGVPSLGKAPPARAPSPMVGVAGKTMAKHRTPVGWHRQGKAQKNTPSAPVHLHLPNARNLPQTFRSEIKSAPLEIRYFSMFAPEISWVMLIIWVIFRGTTSAKYPNYDVYLVFKFLGFT